MAWINRTLIALCVLLFATLPLTSMTYTSKRARENFAATHITKKADKKKSTATTQRVQKTSRETAKKTASKGTTKSKAVSSVKKSSITASKNAEIRSKHAVNKTASASFTEKCAKRKGYKSHRVKVRDVASGTLVGTYKVKMQEVTKVAMNKLMQQIGKPCCQGSSSPHAGFGCSGLVYYAYRDLVKVCVLRTVSEMYHLCDVAPVERSELKNGDLVLFRTQGRGTTDHVGVYVGSDKFI